MSKGCMDCYYEVFLEFLQAVGAYLAIYKMAMNASEGIFPVQVVAYNYGYVDAKMDFEVAARDTERWEKLDDLSNWSKRVGLLPLDQEGKEKLMKFVEDGDRRRYLRDNIKRARDRSELLSIRDLMLKRYALEWKRKQVSKA